MRLASLMATARCYRLGIKKSLPENKVALAQAELRVAKATDALRKHLENCK
jgi:hypothetical protein